jgi:hypothetical protein
VQAVLAFADVRKLPSLAKALKGVDTSRFTTIVYWGKEDAAATEVRGVRWLWGVGEGMHGGCSPQSFVFRHAGVACSFGTRLTKSQYMLVMREPVASVV